MRLCSFVQFFIPNRPLSRVEQRPKEEPVPFDQSGNIFLVLALINWRGVRLGPCIPSIAAAPHLSIIVNQSSGCCCRSLV